MGMSLKQKDRKMTGMKCWIILILCLFSVTFAVAQVVPQGTLTASLSCDSIGSNAFVGCYYNGTDLTNLKGIRTDPSINFNWGSDSPDPAITSSNFSVKWEGDFSFSTGTYRFTATADDGIRLYVDGALLLDKWLDESATTYIVNTFLPEGAH